ncbi:PQQ-dependent sugar dehydrogenase [Aurantivibrio plasticivorans]
MTLIKSLLTLTAIVSVSAFAEPKTETYIEDINVPWGMAWLPPSNGQAQGDMLVTERSGSLYRVRDGKITAEIKGLPDIHANGQGGLLDIELHPQYDENGWIYLSYSSPEGEGKGSNTAIIRGQLNGNRLTNIETLYKAEPNSRRGQHYGSRIEFDNHGMLFFSIGERGDRDTNPQDLSRDGGKIYRLHDDGRIPQDNPFVSDKQEKPAIYSWGHRNPQGMATHPTSGEIWIHEHGPRGGDEINIVKAGENYGWPILSYGINYIGTTFAEGTEREGYQSPIHYWDPSIAPSGMTFVTSDKYPEWQGKLLVGSLKFRYLVLCSTTESAVTNTAIVMKDIGRVRNVKQGPDGYLYVATEGNGILRLTP